MVGEAAKKNLYDAATKGEVAKFQELLREDSYLLDEVSFACSRNLLHIATIWGQLGIVKEVLKINPQLAMSLDSKNSSPLHIAAAQGSLEIAQKLLSVAPEACWWRDCHDMNPVHIASVNGHVEILQLLLQESRLPAMERGHRGQTVLHSCLKHGQVQTLKVLVEKLGELVAAKDDDGETLLHLAVRCDQLEAIQYLVEVKGVIKKDIRNSMGKTAMNISREIPKDTIGNYSEIRRILKKMSAQPNVESMKLSEITLVVVVLIATMAFQVIVNPPGGLWQEDKFSNTTTPTLASGADNVNTSSHRAGGAIMATTNLPMYISLMTYSAVALAASLVTIFLIVSGLPSRHHSFMWAALVALWVSVSSIACCCVVSMLFIKNPGRPPVSTLALWVINMSIYTVGIVPMLYILSH